MYLRTDKKKRHILKNHVLFKLNLTSSLRIVSLLTYVNYMAEDSLYNYNIFIIKT
jgi:hypothetical protein